jgi:hypothetical protein
MARSVQVPAHKALPILATLLICCASYPRRGDANNIGSRGSGRTDREAEAACAPENAGVVGKVGHPPVVNPLGEMRSWVKTDHPAMP